MPAGNTTLADRRGGTTLSLAISAHSHVDSRYDFESMSDSSTRSSTGASTTVSYEAGDFAILGRAGLYRALGGMGLDPIQNVELTTTETWGYTAELRSQFRLSQRWSLNLGATYTSSAFSGSSTASIGGTSFQLKRPDALSVGLAAIYHIFPNRFSVQLGYQHIFIGQRRDEYADPTRDVLASNQRADSLGLALIYRF